MFDFDTWKTPAARDYREQVPRWQARLRAQIDRINAVMVRVFNARFEIERIRTCRGRFGTRLRKALWPQWWRGPFSSRAILFSGAVAPQSGAFSGEAA